MSTLDDKFQEYFASLDKAGDDRCYLCRRTPADVKAFFGFAEDGTPLNADEYGIEDVVLYKLDIMSYSGSRPVCAVCQLNFDTMFAAGDHAVLERVLREIEHQRDQLWPSTDESDSSPNESSPQENE